MTHLEIHLYLNLTDETQCLKYKLVTLSPGTEYIPTIKLGQQNIIVDKTYNGVVTITPTTELHTIQT